MKFAPKERASSTEACCKVQLDTGLPEGSFHGCAQLALLADNHLPASELTSRLLGAEILQGVRRQPKQQRRRECFVRVH